MSSSFFENYLVVLGTLLMGFILLILGVGCIVGLLGGLSYTIQYYFGEEAAAKYHMCIGFILFCMCVAVFINIMVTEEPSWKTYFPILETVVLMSVIIIGVCVCGVTTREYIMNQYGRDAAEKYCACIGLIITIMTTIMTFALFITVMQQQPTESPTMSPTKFYLRSESECGNASRQS